MNEHRIILSHPIRDVRRAGQPSGTSRANGSPLTGHFDPSQADAAADDTTGHTVCPEQRIWESLETLSLQVNELELKRSQSLRELQVVTVELAVTLAERLTHQALAERAHDLQRLVAAALQECQRHRPVIIRLHPDDLQQLQGGLSESQRAAFAADMVELRADDGLSRGDCRADLAEFSLRFDWRHQLDELRTQLLHGLKDAQTERRTPEADGEALQRFPERRETA